MFKKYKIHTTTETFEFTGYHFKETLNWHYFDTDSGKILHFRKSHMIMIEETKKAEYGGSAG